MTGLSLRGLPVVEAQPYAVLPDRYRSTAPPSAWMRRERREGISHSFLEGPVLEADGRLIVCDLARSRIFRVTEGDSFELVYEYDGEPNGLAIGPAGEILIADHQLGLLALAPGSDVHRALFPGDGPLRLKGLNDLAVTRSGKVYVTDQGQTGLHDPSGRLLRWEAGSDGPVVLLDNVPSPNGVAVDAPEATVFLAVTRDNSIWRVPLREDGPTKVGRYIQLSGGIGPDGIALAPDGRLAVAHLGLGVVWIFDALGLPAMAVVSPVGRLMTNLTFDRTGDMVYITEAESGSVLQARLRPQTTG
jgi:gluconolactonase